MIQKHNQGGFLKFNRKRPWDDKINIYSKPLVKQSKCSIVLASLYKVGRFKSCI